MGSLFEEASTVFGDPLAAIISDPDHSTLESRWITSRMSDKRRLLMVSHTDCGEDCIRIISARLALGHERIAYGEA
ncbi:MAG: BrnT family toxin [Candidatus Acidiferrales bacterium]